LRRYTADLLRNHVKIAAISIDRENKMEYAGPSGETAEELYRVVSVPTTILVNGEGRVIGRWTEWSDAVAGEILGLVRR